MSFCSNCGHSLNQTDRFCPVCGQPAAVQQETVPAAVQQETVPAAVQQETAPAAYTAAPEQSYTVPEVPAQPAQLVVPVKTKVLGFVGMGLSIGGLVFAILGILYTFIGLVTEQFVGFAFSIVFGIFSLPLCIVGRSLSNKSRYAGFNATAVTVGANIGLAGIIVTAVMLFLGVINLLSW